MPSIAKYIVAGLGATAAVSAHPQDVASTAASGPSSAARSSASFEVPTVSHPATPIPATPSAAASASAANVALAKQALQAVTNVGRFNALLTVDGEGQELSDDATLRSRLVFDSGTRAAPLGQGGRFILANQNNFPILVNQGISTAVGFLNPCSMNSPHTHPRATEFFTVVQGKFQIGSMLENGFLANATERRRTTQVSVQELGPFQATVFPLGSIHYQLDKQNANKSPLLPLSTRPIPGLRKSHKNTFFLKEAIVNITLGEINQVDGSNIEQFRTSLPANLVQAVDSCLSKCGLN